MRKVCVIMGGVLPVPAVCGGAIETLVTSIAKQYAPEAGFELTICSVYHPEAVKAAERYPNVRFFWTHTRSMKNLFLHAVFLGIRMTTGQCIRPLQRHYNEIAELFRRERFDLILAEGGDTQAIVDIAGGYDREQFVNHVHIHYLPPKNIVENYGHVIGVSEFVASEYRKVCHRPVEGHVLKNAIDVSLFSKTLSQEKTRQLREQLGLTKEDFVILYVGRIMEIKGVLELMQAVTGIEDPHIKLLIMGSANAGKWAYSPYEKNVKALAQANPERIVFTGYVDNAEVYQYASLADVQCVPTLAEEAAGLVVLEAMAEGLPLIATKSGGMVEYVDGDTALFVERKNVVENIREAILYMKAHPQERQRFAENAKKRIQEYDAPIYYQNFVELMHQIMDENPESRKR